MAVFPPIVLLEGKYDETPAEPDTAERVGDEFGPFIVPREYVASVVDDVKYEAGAATIYVPGLVPLGSTVEIVIGATIDESPV